MAMHSTLVNSRPRHGRDTAGAGAAVLGSEASVGIGVDCGAGSGRMGERDDETTAVGASRRPGSAKGAPQGRAGLAGAPCQRPCSRARRASMRRRLVPRSPRPRRDAERTCTTPASRSSQNSASSVNFMSGVVNSARR